MKGPTAAIDAAGTQLEAVLSDRVRHGFPLAPLTTFRIGGAAALYLEVEAEQDLVAVAAVVAATQVPVIVIGKGSNILVAEDGFDGLVLRLGKGYRYAARDGERITAGGAIPVPALAGVAAHHGLDGLGFGAAIPASLGGAIAMNAGAHGHEMSELVEWVQVFSLASGDALRLEAGDLGFAYRHSDVPNDGVVLSASLRLEAGDPEEIRRHMDEARAWRKATQPLAEPNCGSVFKNPPNASAAQLVEGAGAKGLERGKATVSTKHANFIVARPGATAGDVVLLIREVQDRVESATGILLEPEVRLVGAFDIIPR